MPEITLGVPPGHPDHVPPPKACKRDGCPQPTGPHKVRYICPDGTVYNPRTGEIDGAVTARGDTHISSEFKAVLDKASRAGVALADLPKPEDHGCINAKVWGNGFDKKFTTIPADAESPDTDWAEAGAQVIEAAATKLGLKPKLFIGSLIFALMLSLAGLGSIVFRAPTGDGTTQQIIPAGSGAQLEPATPEPSARESVVGHERTIEYRELLDELDWALDNEQRERLADLDERDAMEILRD